MDREFLLLLSSARLGTAWQRLVKFREDDGLERRRIQGLDVMGGKSVFNALCLDCPQKFRDKDKYLMVKIDKKYAAHCSLNLEMPKGMAWNEL